MHIGALQELTPDLLTNHITHTITRPSHVYCRHGNGKSWKNLNFSGDNLSRSMHYTRGFSRTDPGDSRYILLPRTFEEKLLSLLDLCTVYRYTVIFHMILYRTALYGTLYGMATQARYPKHIDSLSSKPYTDTFCWLPLFIWGANSFPLRWECHKRCELTQVSISQEVRTQVSIS